MATTKGRQGSHGKAYSEYAGMKDKAIYVGGEHLDCMTFIDDNKPDMEEIWYEFEEEGSLYPNIKNTCIMLESSPTPEEMKSMGINSDEETLTEEQKSALMDYAKELLDKMDDQEIIYHRKDKNGNFILDENGKKKKFKVPKTHLRNSKWFCMLHRDAKSGIWHLHFLISRFTRGGQDTNDPRMIAKRAARATELLNQSRGWKSAERISIHHQNEIKDTIYDVLRKMDKFSWNDFKDAIEARTFTDYKGRQENYELMFRNDSQGNVVGYSVWRGNSNYNASKIGKQLTASRLYDTWLKLQNEKKRTVTERPKPKPAQPTTYKPHKPIISENEKDRENEELYRRLMEQKLQREKEDRERKAQSQRRNSQHPEAVEARNFLQKWINSSFTVFDRDDQAKVTPGIVARCLDMGLDSRSVSGLMTAAEDFARSFEGAAERIAAAVVECKDTVGIVGLFLPASTPSQGGGGGGQDTGGWRGKDDDDWKWWKENGFKAMRSRGKGRN